METKQHNNADPLYRLYKRNAWSQNGLTRAVMLEQSKNSRALHTCWDKCQRHGGTAGMPTKQTCPTMRIVHYDFDSGTVSEPFHT